MHPAEPITPSRASAGEGTLGAVGAQSGSARRNRAVSKARVCASPSACARVAVRADSTCAWVVYYSARVRAASDRHSSIDGQGSEVDPIAPNTLRRFLNVEEEDDAETGAEQAGEASVPTIW